jgi:hypothetical protein
VEAYLKEEKKSYEKYLGEPKMLLLGSSDSGKSTLLKQLKIIHGNGFTKEEMAQSAKSIQINLIKDVISLIKYIQNNGDEELAEVTRFDCRNIRICTKLPWCFPKRIPSHRISKWTFRNCGQKSMCKASVIH